MWVMVTAYPQILALRFTTPTSVACALHSAPESGATPHLTPVSDASASMHDDEDDGTVMDGGMKASRTPLTHPPTSRLSVRSEVRA